MTTVTCIFCESKGDWSAAMGARLRRSGDERGRKSKLDIRRIETRSPTEARDAWREVLRDGRSAALVVEFTAANFEAASRLLVDHLAEVPSGPRMAVLGRSDAAYESAVREAGATAIVFSPREIGVLLEIVERFAACQPPRRPVDDEQTTAQRLRAALPWSGTGR